MGNPLSGVLTPQIRKWLYTLHGLASLVVGAVLAWCAASADAAQPDWVDQAMAVLTYTGLALGLTAASNVPTPDTDEPGGDGGEVGIVGLLLIIVLVLLVVGLVR
jgi:hypothetical protein